MEYRAKLLRDCFNFMRLVGGAERLCEAGWRPEAAMNADYMEEIEELLLEWLPGDYENMCILKTDDCLEAENKLEKFFKEELATMLDIGWDSYEQI